MIYFKFKDDFFVLSVLKENGIICKSEGLLTWVIKFPFLSVGKHILSLVHMLR